MAYDNAAPTASARMDADPDNFEVSSARVSKTDNGKWLISTSMKPKKDATDTVGYLEGKETAHNSFEEMSTALSEAFGEREASPGLMGADRPATLVSDRARSSFRANAT